MRIKKGEEGDIGCMFLIYAHVELVVDQFVFGLCNVYYGDTSVRIFNGHWNVISCDLLTSHCKCMRSLRADFSIRFFYKKILDSFKTGKSCSNMRLRRDFGAR